MGRPPRIGDTLPRAADAWCVPEKWVAWILAEHGHGPEWRTVLGVGAGGWERAWKAPKKAVQDATVEMVRLPDSGGVGCGVTVDLATGELVELTEPEGAPVGATGGVTDVLGPDRVIVELTSMSTEQILDRIVFVAPDKLRVIEPARDS